MKSITKNLKPLYACGLLVLLLAVACNKDGRQSANCEGVNLVVPNKSKVVEGLYLVQLHADLIPTVVVPNTTKYSERSLQVKDMLVAWKNSIPAIQFLEIKRVYSAVFLGFETLLSPSQKAVLAKVPGVVLIEQVQTVSIQQDCSGPPIKSINSQVTTYGVKRVGTGDGTGKRIWIIDTGIDVDHPDLSVNVSLSRDFTGGSVPGLGDSAAVNDENGHGTHVAGIAGAKNNSIGTVGIAAGAELVALKALNEVGSGNTATIVQALDYIMVVGQAGEVVNMSLGGGVNVLADLSTQQVAAKGLYIAIAAGNESGSANNSSPGRTNGVRIYTISAIDDRDRFATYSNFGNPPIDFAEPGSSILSAYKNGQYMYLSGTSMAAPHMAGILALKGGSFRTDGFAQGDPDQNPDPIAIAR